MNAHNMHSIEWNVMPNGYRAPFHPISLSLTHTRCGYFTFNSKSHKLNCANKSAQNENTVFISFCLRKTICIWFNVICWTLHVINMAVIGHGHCMSTVKRLLRGKEREKKIWLLISTMALLYSSFRWIYTPIIIACIRALYAAQRSLDSVSNEKMYRKKIAENFHRNGRDCFR